MSDDDKTVRVRIGAKMREVWEYINKNPGELEYAIKMKFGRTSKVTERLANANLIEIVENRCYAINGLDTVIRKSQAISNYDKMRQYSFEVALQVPCYNRDCLVPIGKPCFGLTRYGRERKGPHYERLGAAVAAAYRKREELIRTNWSEEVSEQPLSDFLLMIIKEQS